MVPLLQLENVDMVNLPARNDPMGSMSITKIAIDCSPAEGLTPARILKQMAAWPYNRLDFDSTQHH